MSADYQHLVCLFPFLITSYRPYATTDHGKRLAACALFHPVWDDLVSATRALPPHDLHSGVLESLDKLERIKSEHDLHKYAPLSFDWTAQLYRDPAPVRLHASIDMDAVDPAAEAKVQEIPFHADAEPGQPHISVDMDLAEVIADGIFPSTAPVDVEERAVDPLPPIAPALSLSLTDLAEWDEEVMEGQVAKNGEGAILNLWETGHRVPTSGSFSVPESVHTEVGDAGGALRQEDVEEGKEVEEVEEERGSLSSVPPRQPLMDVIASEGERVVDPRFVGPGLDGDSPVSRVLTTGQSS